MADTPDPRPVSRCICPGGSDRFAYNCPIHGDRPVSPPSELHETHVCRDCAAEITIPYARAAPQADAGLLRELAEAYHVHGLISDHHDRNDKTGWIVKGIETCGDPLCVAALAATEDRPVSKHRCRKCGDDEYDCRCDIPDFGFTAALHPEKP